MFGGRKSDERIRDGIKCSGGKAIAAPLFMAVDVAPNVVGAVPGGFAAARSAKIWGPGPAGSRAWIGVAGFIKTRNVATGTISIATSAPAATRYRVDGRREKAIRIAASAAMPRHCHNEWIRVQPSACMTSVESQLLSVAIIVSLIFIQNAAEFIDFFG